MIFDETVLFKEQALTSDFYGYDIKELDKLELEPDNLLYHYRKFSSEKIIAAHFIYTELDNPDVRVLNEGVREFMLQHELAHIALHRFLQINRSQVVSIFRNRGIDLRVIVTLAQHTLLAEKMTGLLQTICLPGIPHELVNTRQRGLSGVANQINLANDKISYSNFLKANQSINDARMYCGLNGLQAIQNVINQDRYNLHPQTNDFGQAFEEFKGIIISNFFEWLVNYEGSAEDYIEAIYQEVKTILQEF